MNFKSLPLEFRPREKAKREGVESLSNVELLAILLQTGIKGKDVITLASEILDSEGGLYSLSNSTYKQLDYKGLGEVKKLKLLACFELSRRAKEEGMYSIKVESSKKCVDLFGKDISFLKEERLIAVYLDGNERLIKKEVINYGNAYSCNIDFKKILQKCLANSSYYLYLIHNHPSGSSIPSKKDEDFTKALAYSLSSIGVILLDHLIVSGNEYSSIRKFLDKRQNNNK
jgi:DNA repair protein RadC